jgi:hypothetical protein
MTETTSRMGALMERLHQLAPDRPNLIGFAPITTERYAESVLAVAMEKHVWTCPCGAGHELTVASNLDAPGPNAPVTIHDDEGQPTGWCPRGHELDILTLVPMLVWHVAQAGVFGLVDDDGNFTSADTFEDEMRAEAEASAARGGSAVAKRYRAFTDPAKAVEAATRAMRRDPEDLIQIIPEALTTPGFR